MSNDKTVCGILNVIKPLEWSSQDVVRYFKRNCLIKGERIGHIGTLDPFADGVLLLAFGAATKLNDYLHDYYDKTYLARGLLGIQTDSADLTGKVIQEDRSAFLEEVIGQFSQDFIHQQLIDDFSGEYWQVPPYFSAVKYQGRKLHQWAREGVFIKKAPVLRIVSDLKITEFQFPYMSLQAKVSSGTYIRTLFEDCVQKLGTLGHLTELRRLAIGPFTFDQGLLQENWPVNREEFLQLHLRSLEDSFPMPILSLAAEETQSLSVGRTIHYQRPIKNSPYYWCCTHENKNLGLAQIEQKKLRMVINLHSYSIDCFNSK